MHLPDRVHRLECEDFVDGLVRLKKTEANFQINFFKENNVFGKSNYLPVVPVEHGPVWHRVEERPVGLVAAAVVVGIKEGCKA